MNRAGIGGRGPSRGHRDGVSPQQTIVPVLAMLAMAGWAVACGDGAIEPSPPPPEARRATTVAVTPATAELAALGATEQFSAEVRDQNGQEMVGAAVTWSSADGSVAAVDASGLATAVGNGAATITVAAGSVSGTAVVVVMQSADSVTVSPTTDTIVIGDTLRLTAEAYDADGRRVEGAEFNWTSSDESVATVNPSGLVHGIAEGTTTITGTAGSAQGTARIAVANPNYAPPYRGTAFLDPDVIVPSDPTDFVGLEPAGRGERFVYDRRHGWITIEAYLFDVTFANGLFAEFQVNPEFGTWTEAEAVARAYAPAIGQIPVALREDMEAVWIHRGDEPFGGGNRSLLVHADRGQQYREREILPEIFVHEGVHTSLDSAHADAPGWLAAQAADPTFISTYARDHPGREDLAESFSAWLAVRHRRDRITEGMADTITSAIPHRLAYFDSLELDLCPVTGRACEARVIDMEWAADFVARQHVVDVMNVGIRVDPNCTADCERTLFPGDGRRDLGGIKEATGIDMSMTNPGQGNYPEQFSDGRVANVRVVRTYEDIEVARQTGDFAIMWYLQTRPATGRWQLGGDVGTLRDWYDQGLRVLQIAYGSHREDARGPDERLGYGAGEGDENGVTDLGRLAISEMNQLGMVVDCSHCNRQTTLDAASMSTKPILANHANAKALTDDPYERNKTDEELMAIAATGGVIGVTPIRLFLDTDGDGVTGMDDMIAHVEYIASLVGIDHVGIATDTYVDGWEPSSHHYASADLAALDRWVRLTARLRARGWSEEDLAKLLGGNFLRVFREVLRPQ